MGCHVIGVNSLTGKVGIVSFNKGCPTAMIKIANNKIRLSIFRKIAIFFVIAVISTKLKG